tara:strand:+ start:112 stop:1740 length:1629 start_codon:yes stop_codon:yes gene_type:complete
MNNWWKKACVYQIYPASFKDTTGSGKGDLKGIISKLDYLALLGIDVIWLSPVYASPMKDNGYDISDYYGINPMFGTMEDMDLLIEEAKKRGIKIIMDLVVNHTSDQHPWFKEACADVKSPYRDYYIWRDNRGTLPNDLESIFGGPAWTLDQSSNQYYMHLFAKEQPDLNWDNENLRRDVYKMMNWWLKKGIAGFRMDVIDLIGKIPDEKITENGPKLHSYIQEMNQATFSSQDVLTVGECWGADLENSKLYSNPDGSELSMVFQFHHIKLRWKDGNKWDTTELDLNEFKRVISDWQTGLHGKGWNSLFLGNHDLPRSVSYWGNDGIYREESAKMLASLLHGLQGTPFIYQGDEIGMTNVGFENLDQYRDIESINFYDLAMEKGISHESALESMKKIGRDNARTPMQWDGSENGGFTSGKPWIDVNPNHKEIHVEKAISDTDSIFHHYKKLIGLRKSHKIFTEGSFKLLFENDPNLFVYVRENEHETLLCVNNYSDQPRLLDLSNVLPENESQYEILVQNYKTINLSDRHVELKPYESLLILF